MPTKSEEALRNRLRHFLELPDQTNPGHFIPKEDKIQEWALVQIVEQLKTLNFHLAKISSKP
jgi:hypothetical protein